MRRLILLLGLTACTDAELQALGEVADDRVDLRGELCTTAPQAASHPVRVLFAVDSSDSMLFNDPNDLHVDAIENVVAGMRDDANVSFGILRWGERVVRELVDYSVGAPAFFTKDEVLLGEAFARMRALPVDNADKYLGGTDYEGALDAVRDYILADLAQNPASSAIHQYYVEFMTDGMPQSGTNAPSVTRNNILTKIDVLRQDHGIRLDTISIVEIATVTPEFFDLLPAMAEHGFGSFLALQTPESLGDSFAQILTDELLLLEFDLATLSTSEEPKSFIAYNRNRRIAEVGGVIDLYVDSDGDGLVDAEEALVGTDAAAADTDGDGLDDYFETHFFGEFDPRARLSPALTLEQLADGDGDGLSAYIEERLGTNPGVADSDGDHVIDGLEWRAGSSPLSDDMGADPDGDGVSTAHELRQHTHPRLDEGAALRHERSYGLDASGGPQRIFDGRRCYAAAVRNISLAETLPHVDLEGIRRPAGYNHIQLSRVEQPSSRADGQPVPLLSRAVRGRAWMIFRPSADERDPPATELSLREVNFEP